MSITSSCSTSLSEGVESVQQSVTDSDSRCNSAVTVDSMHSTRSGRSSKSSSLSQHSKVNYSTQAKSTIATTNTASSIKYHNNSTTKTSSATNRSTTYHSPFPTAPHHPKLVLRSSLPKIEHVSPYLGVDRFSAKHPMIPKRYVPPWQLDMKNRERTLQVYSSVYDSDIFYLFK